MSLTKNPQFKDVLCLVFSLICITNAQEQCYKEDFAIGTLGIMTTTCEGGSLFDVKKYDDYADVFLKPVGANDYFITPGKDDFSCVETGQPLEVVVGTELQLSVLTSNPGGMIFAFWMMTDSKTGSLITSTPIFIDNTRKWRTYKFTAPRNGSVNINLQCEELSKKNAFLAIDYMTIKEPNAEDCSDVTISTTSTPSESTYYTEATTLTTVTPDPPTSLTCNCNCNCNFQCNSNF